MMNKWPCVVPAASGATIAAIARLSTAAARATQVLSLARRAVGQRFVAGPRRRVALATAGAGVVGSASVLGSGRRATTPASL